MSKTDRTEAVGANHLCKVMPSIKFSFNNQVRRTKTVENLPTYDFLKFAAKKLFPALHQFAEFDFSWSDDEGDTIFVSSDKELIEAIRIMNIEHRAIYRFEVRGGLPTTPLTSLPVQADSAIPIIKKVLHPDVKCFECDRNGKGGSSIAGVRYKCLVRHLDLCEDCEMIERQPFPMIKYYFPEKLVAVTTSLERRRRMGRGSLKGPHFRIHSRGLILNSLEQPHPKSPTWLSYLRSLSSGPTSSTLTSTNQRESANPRKFSRLPFCLKLTAMEPAIVPFNIEQPAAADSESIASYEVVGKPIPADALPVQAAPLSKFNFSFMPAPTTPSPKPLCCVVRDRNFSDSAKVLSGSIFLKTWRIRNIGALNWPPNVVLLYSGGDLLTVGEEDLALAVARLGPGQGMFFCFLTLPKI
jgi:hypothetical protein